MWSAHWNDIHTTNPPHRQHDPPPTQQLPVGIPVMRLQMSFSVWQEPRTTVLMRLDRHATAVMILCVWKQRGAVLRYDHYAKQGEMEWNKHTPGHKSSVYAEACSTSTQLQGDRPQEEGDKLSLIQCLHCLTHESIMQFLWCMPRWKLKKAHWRLNTDSAVSSLEKKKKKL